MIWEFGWLSVIVVIVILAFSAFRILREYQRGVVFMLGRFWKEGPRADRGGTRNSADGAR